MTDRGKITRLHDYVRMYTLGHKYMGRVMWVYVDRIKRFKWSND